MSWTQMGIGPGRLLLLRSVALLHAGSGLALLFQAAKWSLGCLASGHGQQPLLVLVTFLPPFILGAFGAVLLTLGHWLWHGHPRLRTILLVGNGVLLLPGALATAVGISAVRAAEMSSARGGGLLSPLAWLPLLGGGALVSLATVNLLLALLVVPRTRRDDENPL